MRSRRAAAVVVLGGILAIASTAGPRAQTKLYDPAVDARAQIAKAVQSAATDDIRVLVSWGTGDNPRSDEMARAVRDAKPQFLSDEYRPVYVDVGHLDRNLDVAKAYGVTLSAADLPVLTVLDRRGAVVASVSSRELLASATGRVDLARVRAFLEAHQSPAPDAVAAFDAGLAQATRDGKTLFVWFSAPW